MKKLFAVCLLFLQIQMAHALIFERRNIPDPEFSWFIYPVAGEIPGVQKFFGVGATLSAIGNPISDVTYVRLTGESKHIEGEDFQIDLLTALDLPLWYPYLSFSVIYSDIRHAAFPEPARGIDSDKDESYILLGTRVFLRSGEVSLSFFDDQVEFYYGKVTLSVDPYGLVTPDGTLYNADRAKLNEKPEGWRYGFYLDDTDNRRDPRVGYRFQYEHYRIPQSRAESSSYFQTDYNYTIFVPFAEKSHVVVLNYFRGTSKVDEEGTVDREIYTCGVGAPAQCQTDLDKVYEKQAQESKLGRATSLGGPSRLRGYPANRFFDSYTGFRAIEWRWYLAESNFPYNFLVSKGTYTGFQLALFYEEGSVAPEEGQLWDKFKTSSGFGLRFLMSTVVIRIDMGFSPDEGSQRTVFIGYPF